MCELHEVIYEDAYETIISRDDSLACPRCGSISIVKKGHLSIGDVSVEHDRGRHHLAQSGGTGKRFAIRYEENGLPFGMKNKENLV